MPRDINSNFSVEKNKEENTPIYLYRVNTSDTPEITGEEDLFLAEYPEDVSFFKTDDGVNTPQVYRSFPITNEGFPENLEGKIDSVTITIGNVSQEIQAYLENREGLRGRKVTIRQVFLETLADEDAYIEDVFKIDGVDGDEKTVVFKLYSELDVTNERIPRRFYYKNLCQNDYKEEGCWLRQLDGSYIAPSGFHTEETDVFAGPDDDSGNPADSGVTFKRINLFGLQKSSDYVIVDLKCSNPGLMTAAGFLEISSSDTDGLEAWRMTDLTGLGITSSYVTYTIPLATWADQGGTYDVTRTKRFRWRQPSSAGSITISWRNLKVKRLDSIQFINGDPDSCNKGSIDCTRHNNRSRMLAFPGIPSKRVFRVG